MNYSKLLKLFKSVIQIIKWTKWLIDSSLYNVFCHLQDYVNDYFEKFRYSRWEIK